MFAATAEHGADIRDYGLTPELLTACQRALAAWGVQRAPLAHPEPGVIDDAAWQAYARMVAAHGEDFS
jgi:hypothetical protein